MRSTHIHKPTMFEPLDPRLFMAIDLVVNGTEAADQFRLIYSDNYIKIDVKLGPAAWKTLTWQNPARDQNVTIKSLGGSDQIVVGKAVARGAIRIDAGAGDDIVTVGESGRFADTISNRIDVVGGSGRDQLRVDNSDGLYPVFKDVWTITDKAIAFGGEYRDGSGTFPGPAVGYDTSIEAATLYTGDEHNIIRIDSTSASTPVTIYGDAGNSDIRVGRGDIDSNIKSTLMIHCGGGADSVFLNDAVDSGDDVYDLGGSILRKADAGAIYFFDNEKLTLDANFGHNTIRVDGVFCPTTIHGSAGNDQFFVGLGTWDRLRNDVVLDGQSGDDSVVIDDTQSTAAATYRYYYGTVNKATNFDEDSTNDPGRVLPLNVGKVSLRGGKGSDHFLVYPTRAFEIEIRGGAQQSGSEGDSLSFVTGDTPLVENGPLWTRYRFANSLPIVATGIEARPSFGASIGGVLFNDKNGNGHRDAPNDGLLSGRWVYIDLDNDKVWDADERRTSTNGDGKYLFVGVAAGTYKVRQIIDAGWEQTTPANGYGHTVSVAGDQQASGFNFGSRKVPV